MINRNGKDVNSGKKFDIIGVRDTIADVAYTRQKGYLGVFCHDKHSQKKIVPEKEQKKGTQVYLGYIPVSVCLRAHTVLNILHLSRKQQCAMYAICNVQAYEITKI